MIPFHEGVGEGPIVTILGLWLYDLLAGFRNVRRHRRLSRAEVLAREPNLRREGLLGGAIYYDCFADDFRLVLLNASMAFEEGARILTYARVESLVFENGRVAGVRFRDLLSGLTHEARGRVIINGTGAWSDRIRLMAPGGRRLLRPTKGAHILVPRSKVGNLNAVVMRSPEDERVVFALPWREFTLAGTTDTDFEGDLDGVGADDRDVHYLLESLNHTFPEANLTQEDVFSSFAALRPLIAEYDVPESEVSRDYRVVRDAAGMISLLGGKLTTYRRAAMRIVRLASRDLRRAGRLPHGPEVRPAWRASEVGSNRLRRRASRDAESMGLDGDIVENGVASYGPRWHRVLEIAQDEALRRRIVPGLPYILAEVVHSQEHEMALKLEDVLVRRTKVMHEDADHGLGVAEEVAGLMAQYAGWSDERVKQELEEYENLVRSMATSRKEE